MNQPTMMPTYEEFPQVPVAPEQFDFMNDLEVEVGGAAVNAVVFAEMANQYDANRYLPEQRDIDKANQVIQGALFDDVQDSSERVAKAVAILNANDKKRSEFIAENHVEYGAIMAMEQQAQLAHLAEEEAGYTYLADGTRVKKAKKAA